MSKALFAVALLGLVALACAAEVSSSFVLIIIVLALRFRPFKQQTAELPSLLLRRFHNLRSLLSLPAVVLLANHSLK